MKMHRLALSAAGALAFAASAAVSPALAQRTVEPDARLLVPTFRSADRGLGVQGAEAVRGRVSKEVPQKQLLVIDKKFIDETLTASGYRPDSALSANDTRELAKLMRADEILDGLVTKTDTGVRVDARLLLARDVSLAQPLPPAYAKNVSDAAKQIASDLKEARKQLGANRACENALRQGDNAKAVEEAKKGIAAYPNATLARLCLASALQAQKVAPESLLAVTNEILRLDPKSAFALRFAYDAYTKLNQTDKATEALVDLWETDPTNQQLTEQVISALVGADPARAADLVAKVVAQNPGDPALVRTQWLVLLNARNFKKALEVGESLARLDTAAADSTWYTRMIAAAAADSQPQQASALAARAVQKYPNSAAFYALQAQVLRSAGQIPQSVAAIERAVAIDPKVENGYLLWIVGLTDQGLTDSAKVVAQKAIAGGADKTAIGNAMLAMVGPAVKKAQETKARADWQEVLRLASGVDEMAPSANSKFFVGLSAFQVGLDYLQGLNKSKSCADVKAAEDAWNTAQIAMPAGASVDKAAAGQILGVIQQYGSNIAAAKKAFCK